MEAPTTSSLSTVLQAAIDQIRAGLPDGATLDEPVRLELTTVLKKDRRGGLEFRVIGEGAEIPGSQIHRLSVAITIRHLKEGGAKTAEPVRDTAGAKKAPKKKAPRPRHKSSFERKRESLLFGPGSRKK